MENAEVRVPGPGHAQLTVRAVDGVDMIELEARGLTSNTHYTAAAERDGRSTPLLSFTTDTAGNTPQALAFLRFLGGYNVHDVEIRREPR